MEETPIKDLIDRWGNRAKLADEIGANAATVHKWAAANRIPAAWQAKVIRAAQAQGFTEIDGNWMVRHHEGQRAA